MALGAKSGDDDWHDMSIWSSEIRTVPVRLLAMLSSNIRKTYPWMRVLQKTQLTFMSFPRCAEVILVRAPPVSVWLMHSTHSPVTFTIIFTISILLEQQIFTCFKSSNDSIQKPLFIDLSRRTFSDLKQVRFLDETSPILPEFR